MKRLLAAAMMAALLIVAGVSISRAADTALGVRPFNNNISGVGGLSAADSTRQSFWFQNQSLLTSETTPFYDVLLGPTVVVGPGTTFTAGTADSNAVPLDTHRASSGTLYFKFWRTATGTGTIARFAVQVRGHVNAGQDSASVFPLMPMMTTQQSSTDTLAVGQTFTGSATAAWSGEWVLTVDLARGSPLNGTAAVAFQYPSGMAINLARIYGPSLGVSYMSVRVRQIAGPTCLATVTYDGRP